MSALTIKLVSKNPIARFQLFDLPQNHNARFVLEGDDYDWLVVWDDLPPSKGERFSHSIIEAQCSGERTALMTYEPSSIKYYGADYVNQFGMVLTAHEPHKLPHHCRRNMPPVGYWYYGGMAEIAAHPTPPPKTQNVSLFHSDKQQSHTLHATRFDFLQTMMTQLEGVSAFGRGIRPVQHKAEGIDDFRYHIAVENHISPHHWTEKLSDCFLGYSLPFYAGCPNAADYFPAESFIPIDMTNPKGALEIIRAAIAAGEYEKRLSAICEARRRVMEDYNLGNMIAKHITARETELTDTPQNTCTLYSRHAMTRRSPAHLLRYGWGKLKNRQK